MGNLLCGTKKSKKNSTPSGHNYYEDRRPYSERQYEALDRLWTTAADTNYRQATTNNINSARIRTRVDFTTERVSAPIARVQPTSTTLAVSRTEPRVSKPSINSISAHPVTTSTERKSTVEVLTPNRASIIKSDSIKNTEATAYAQNKYGLISPVQANKSQQQQTSHVPTSTTTTLAASRTRERVSVPTINSPKAQVTALNEERKTLVDPIKRHANPTFNQNQIAHPQNKCTVIFPPIKSESNILTKSTGTPATTISTSKESKSLLGLNATAANLKLTTNIPNQVLVISASAAAHSPIKCAIISSDHVNRPLQVPNEFRQYERYMQMSLDLLNSFDKCDGNLKTQTYKSADTLTFTNKNYVTPSIENNQNQKTKYNLKPYMPRHEIRIFFNNKFKNFEPSNTHGYRLLRLINELKSKPNQLTEQNYLDALHLFSDLEDLHCEEAIRVYNTKSQQLKDSNKPRKFIINISNLKDSRPKISVSSRITIIPEAKVRNKKFIGTITDIQAQYITVAFDDEIDIALRYDVNFLSNRTTFRMEKLAVELMRQKSLVHFMFPNKQKMFGSKVAKQLVKQQSSWFNKSVASNAEQRIAIENMYNGTSYPYPYILFGPPGTGKTTTLVECILQIWQNNANSNILVVSTSNSACNVISKRLLEFLPDSNIFRIFSKTQEEFIDKIDSTVLKVSNLRSKQHYIPTLSELYSYRVVVATPTASGRLIQADFNTDFFTHLFIDECGSCTEGSSLIPIAGLISTQNKIKANIVLSGDPLQLRPVIYSKYAENLGYGVSMIERLMEFPLYKKDDRIADYNNKYITKLRINYRSHRHILHVSNQLFYENELKACGSADITDWVLQWSYLPNLKFPIMFEAVFGESLSENDSPSLYNKQEIKTVMSYLKLLMNSNIHGKLVRQSDIGIISPYRRQNQKIRALCDNRKWPDIEVASVEAFQGSEKSIIIFSTVRSNVDTMGFLNNERRLNVALTRAQACLIIIGDPKVLMKDNCWYQLMKFCYDNNAICGESFDFYS